MANALARKWDLGTEAHLVLGSNTHIWLPHSLYSQWRKLQKVIQYSRGWMCLYLSPLNTEATVDKYKLSEKPIELNLS